MKKTDQSPSDCPCCNSANTKYVEKKGFWRCQDCDKSFPPASATASAAAVISPQRIFISYPHQPREHVELVREIYRRLQERGHLPWMDESEIHIGTEWRERITDGILASDWVIACLSAHSVRDPGVCLNELGIALNQKAGDDALRTVLLEDEKTARPPMSLTHIQWLDLTAFDSHRPRDASKDDQRRHWDSWLDREIGKLISSIEGGGRITGDIAELAQRLRPSGFVSEIADKTHRFTGRTWLFEKVEYWRQHQRGHRILWIKGQAGVGKSAIAAQLAHRERSSVLGIHFCKWNDASTHSAAQFVRTMAFQIASRHSDYRKLLRNILEQKFPAGRLLETSWEELFRELIANPLAPNHMVIDAGRDRQLIVIDGLDEARDREGKNDILDLIANEFPKLPEWLGVVVTSRPAQEIVGRLSSPFELDAQSMENFQDVTDYLYREFEQRIGSAHLAHTVELAARHANGNMLYASELLGAIDRGHVDPLKPTSFPDGLSGIYYNNFRRLCPDLAAYRSGTGPLLELIVACPVPLPEMIGKAVLGLGSHGFNDAVKPISTLLTRRHSGHQVSMELFHKSLGEWLVNPENPHDYQIETLGAYRLADFLWDDFQAAMGGRAINEEGCHTILANNMKSNHYFPSDQNVSPRYWLNQITDVARDTAKDRFDLPREFEFVRRIVNLRVQAFGTAHDLFEMAFDDFKELERQLGSRHGTTLDQTTN